jgi:hypothetical protein
LIFLSNNKAKIRQLEAAHYSVKRVKSLGTVNAAGAQEAEERGTEFGHMDIDPSFISFEEEMNRLIHEVAAVATEANLAQTQFEPAQFYTNSGSVRELC